MKIGLILLILVESLFGQAQITVTIPATAQCPNGGLSCLVGPAGPQGPQGIPGPTGPQGPAGTNGTGGGTTPPIPVTRLVPGTSMMFFPGDYYLNSPINRLPLDPNSSAIITQLGTARMGPDYEFFTNLTTSGGRVAPITWSTPTVTDPGSYTITPTSQVSNYSFGNTNNVSDYTSGCATGCGFGGDGHVLMITTDTGFLYEMVGLANNAPPYQAGNGAIWNLQGYPLRSAVDFTPFVTDLQYGKTSADAAGMPIAPFVLSHAEAYGGKPIIHALRFTLPGAASYQWPATHTGGSPTGIINMGTTFRLPAAFDITTCHNADNNGQPYPTAFQQVLIAMQMYGLYYADNGTSGLVSMDTDQAWGNGTSTSDMYTFSGWLHCILLSDLEVVSNQPRIINVMSGQVNLNFVAR